MHSLFHFLPFLWSYPTEHYFRDHVAVQPPHCAKTPFVFANISTAHSELFKTVQLQFDIGLHTTVCFRLSEDEHKQNPKSSWLHTIRLDRLEHHHPPAPRLEVEQLSFRLNRAIDKVVQHYEFAIPEVRADCVCECYSTADTCTAETHQFTTCPVSELEAKTTSCYRTFFPNQAPTGCPLGSNPKLCCDVKFRPYKNQIYLAVKIEPPTTFATFVYTAYDFNHSRWQEKERSTIRLQLGGGTQDEFVDTLKRISLAATAGGRASHQLDSGMYFADSNPGGEMGDLRKQALNEFAENNFEQLGWYRKQNGRFVVNNGQVRMDDIHKAKVVNCKEQTYISVLSAHHYMPGHFNPTSPLETVYPWIQSARLYDGTTRQVVVTHAKGTNLHITLQVTGDKDGHQLTFFHNKSRIHDFTGTVMLDSRSNRYLNLTVFGASGKINGVLKRSTNMDSDEIYSFTTYVHDLLASNRSMMIPLPAVVESGARIICLKAEEQSEEKSICRIVEYHESPLEFDIDENTWHEMVGNCPSCNTNFNGFTKYLNPMSWVNGVSSLGEFVTMITDVLFYLCVLLVVYIVLTSCSRTCKCYICPIYCCAKGDKKEYEEHKDKKKKQSEIMKDGSDAECLLILELNASPEVLV